LVVPGIVAAFIVMILFDRGGEISRILKPLGVSMPKLVRDDWSLGVIIALAWKSIPFMTLIIGGALASIPVDLAAAARSLGANRLVVFWQIELPLALPGITAAVLLVFVGSIGAFAVPSLLGPIYPKPLSVWMYEAAYQHNDWGLANAMGIVMSAIACAVLLAYYSVTQGLRHATGGETR
jgi:putative spermidine/putrescine transport system permease protein